MPLISLVTFVTALSFSTLFVLYELDGPRKERTIRWLSRHLFRHQDGISPSAERLHQFILTVLFLPAVGLTLLFFISFFEA